MANQGRISDGKKVIILFAFAVCFCMVLALFAQRYLDSLSAPPGGNNAQESDSEHGSDSRYGVDVFNVGAISANTSINFLVNIYDIEHQRKLVTADLQSDKPAYVVFVDSELNYFTKINLSGDDRLSFESLFPHPGIYTGYVVFQPQDQARETRSFNVNVNGDEYIVSSQQADTSFVRQVGDLKFELRNPASLNATEMNRGDVGLEFKIGGTSESYDPESVYVVMFNHQTYEMARTHSHNNPGDQILTFDIEHGMTIVPGEYKVFLDFNFQGREYVAGYTVEVR